jgi:DNA-3-methyladenine glycosylase
MKILDHSFYLRPTLTVARALLGKIFFRRYGEELLSGRIVEVEAYHEDGDESSHSYGGRRGRNDVMFRAGGHLYVYFTYGMHFCMNVVTEKEGIGAAVLIRGIEPVAGIDVMRELRGNPRREHDLTNGPAKICQAFAIAREENGLLLDGSVAGIADAPAIPAKRVITSSRVGISRSRALPWRFHVAESPWVSRGRPSHP